MLIITILGLCLTNIFISLLMMSAVLSELYSKLNLHLVRANATAGGSHLKV